MVSIWSFQFQSLSYKPSIWGSKHWLCSNVLELSPNFGFSNGYLNWKQSRTARRFVLKAVNSSVEGKGAQNEVISDDSVKSKYPIVKFHQIISSFPNVVFLVKRHTNAKFAIGLCIAMAFCFVAVRVNAARKLRNRRPGSVADLVRRGQLRSDRRGISRPLKYEDPFNNPMVKVGKGNSTVEMFGKVYRLAPVTLTEEQQTIHQNRRSRAYQWKRPTVFLKEGDSIPPDVDPDTIRWIPANHPFATTASDIDEDLAQNNVYQKHGVPFRIQAEHEALQRKLEALQSEQKIDKLVIDPTNAKEFERPFKSPSKSHEHADSSDDQDGNFKQPPPKSDSSLNSFGSNSS